MAKSSKKSTKNTSTSNSTTPVGHRTAATPPANDKKNVVAAAPELTVAKNMGKLPTNTIILAILAAVSCLAYFNTLWNSFVLDDVMVLKDNFYVKQGISAIPDIFTTPHMRGYLVIPNDLYRPFSLALFALEYQFFGPNASVYHFFNIIIYAGCVLAFFTFLHKFFDRQKPIMAFVIALIFALHPIHTEVTANIKSSDELLCFLFAFLSLNCYMVYHEKNKILFLLLGTLCFFISILSKETVITFLAVIPVLFFFYKHTYWKKALTICATTVGVFAVFMLIRNNVLNHFQANQPNIPVEFVDNALSLAPNPVSKLATEILVMGLYLKQTILPYPLLSNYSYKSIPFVDFGNIWVLLTIIVYVALVYVMAIGFIRKKKEPWAFSIFFFFATISLFSNFPFLMGAELAERFAFFASAGVCIAAGAAFEKWILKGDSGDITALAKPAAMGILLAVCIPFFAITFLRNFDWQSNYALYKTDSEKSPNDGRLHYYYGTALAEGHYDAETDTNKKKAIDSESIRQLRASLTLCSEYTDYTEANAEIGRVFYREGQYDSAEVHDKRAVKINPTHKTGLNNLGSVYLTTGRYAEAIQNFRSVINLDSSYSFAYFNMARAWNQLKQYDSAIYYYARSVRFSPENVDAVQELGMAYYFKQQWDSAAVYFRKALALKPNDANCINNLGAIYLNTKQYNLAIDLFQKTLQANPNYLNAYTNLVRSYYNAGRYNETISTVLAEVKLFPKYTGDIPFICLCYKKLGKMDSARKYEAVAKQFYPKFDMNTN
jgi:protein O-mannosyl-transferase